MKSNLKWVVPAVAMALSTAGALAQGPPGAGGPGGGQMPPEFAAFRKKMEKFNANNKHFAALTRTLRSLGRLEEDPKTALTKDQAKKLLVIYKAWKPKPTMSNEQAKDVNKQINGILNIAQIKKLNTGGAGGPGGGGGGFRMGGGGGAGGGGGRPGGGGPGGPPGGMANFKFPEPSLYNPFNPSTSPFAKQNPQMAQRFTQRFNEFITKLEAKAK
jgi:hypothetical protein